MSARLLGKLWLFIPLASSESGIPESTLRTQCREGRRRCRKVGKGRGQWQVLASEIRNGGGGEAHAEDHRLA